MKKKIMIISIIAIILIIVTALIIILLNQDSKKSQEVLKQYFALIEQKNYEEMYNLVELPEGYSKDEFLARNKNIYEGIDTNSINIEVQKVEKNKDNITISYITKMSLKSGDLEFENTVNLIKNENKQYKINWSSNLIFPELNNDYKVRVKTVNAERGDLLDRNGQVIAGESLISRIGIVPGKLGENREENIAKIAKLLNMSTETINKELSASWVKDDTFVPIKNVSFDNNELKDKLLEISGIMIDSETDRVYPYKEATSHITGYIQGITAEELETKKIKDTQAHLL